MLATTEIGSYLGETLSSLGIGIFMPFIVAAALKTAQGSSTVALVTTSALVAPMLGDIGLASEMGRALTVLAIGAGAMTVSHANDSFFWVVSQFSNMSVSTAYRAQTMANTGSGYHWYHSGVPDESGTAVNSAKTRRTMSARCITHRALMNTLKTP